MAYGYYRSITVDHTKVSTNDQSNFPWVFTTAIGRLSAAINNSQTTLRILQEYTSSSIDATKLSNGDTIMIEAEQLTVSSGAGTSSITVVRGVNGTSAAAHGTTVQVANLTLYGGLRTVANGGHVTSSSGYDIVIASNTLGTSLLTFETVRYDAASGLLWAWVKSSTLSHTSDTVVYLCYGNAAISTYQGNNAGVWSNGYLGVWHLSNDGTTLNLTDSLGSLNGTNHSEAVGFLVLSGGVFGSGTAYVDVGGASALNTSTVSMEAWVLPTSAGTPSMVVTKTDLSGGNPTNGYEFYTFSNGITTQFANGSGWSGQRCTSGVSSSVMTMCYTEVSGTTVKSYLNASSASLSSIGSGATGVGNSTAKGTIGARPDTTLPFAGNISEARISNVTRAADWITTQYNNQNSPWTFWAVGTETQNIFGNFITPCMDGGMRPQLKGGFNG